MSTSTNGQRPLVVVAGFGGAGAAAAVSAAESGADVLVVERAPEGERGGNTRYNRFYMLMTSPSELTSAFVENVRGLERPWTAESGPSPETAKFWGLDPEFVDVWIDQALPTVKWLEDMGLPFSYELSDILDPEVLDGVIPAGGGKGMLDHLEKRARELGVEFAYETTLVDVSLDETGTVSAVVLESDDGRRTVPCKSVVLATGGFHGNQELVTRYLGGHAHLTPPIARGGYYNQGEGLRVGLRHNAATSGDLGDWHAVALDARADGLRWLLTGTKLGVLVNLDGVRFADEALGEPAVKMIRDQRDGLAYLITDARTRRHEHFKNRFNSADDVDPILADTIEELAEKIGVPADSLSQTLNEYNEACKKGESAGSGGAVGLAIPKSSDAFSLMEGPFEAWPTRAGMVFSLGGLKVDQYGRVLTVDHRPLHGMYAAGDTVGGYFRGYVSYTSTVKALVLGRVGGAHAVRHEVLEDVQAGK